MGLGTMKVHEDCHLLKLKYTPSLTARKG